MLSFYQDKIEAKRLQIIIIFFDKNRYLRMLIFYVLVET